GTGGLIMRSRIRTFVTDAAAVLALTFATQFFAHAQTPKAPPGLDTAAIDRALGKSGVAMAGDVYRVPYPRTDLTVTVGDVKVKPGLALGSWAAFKAKGANAVVHGDLVLLDSEINPVITSLQQHNFDITAVHNHLLSESPSVMYVHYWGEGPAAS